MAFMVKFSVTGLKRTMEQDAAMAERALDLRPAFRSIERASARHQDRLFQTRGASGGSGKWKPRRRPGRGRLLQRSGRLRRGVSRPGGERVFLYNKQEVYLWGTRTPYAAYHHHGTRNLPKRRLIDPSPRDIEEYADIIENWILEGVAQ